MVNELVMKDRLEGLLRVLDAGHKELAQQLIRAMIDEIDLQVEEFEKQAEASYKQMQKELAL